MYENHPIVGVGVASQPAASRDETSGARSKRLKTSHTAPLTVAAELGIAGILVYVAFLVGAALFFWRLRADDDALGLALLGVLTVLVMHSLSYGVFFEDPVLWVALGVGAAAVLGRERRAASRSAVRAASRVGARTGRALVQAGLVVSRRDVWLLLGALGALVLVTATSLGSDPWEFRPGTVHATGPFAALVRGADGSWDTEAVRAPALLAGLLVALARRSSRRCDPRGLAGRPSR